MYAIADTVIAIQNEILVCRHSVYKTTIKIVIKSCLRLTHISALGALCHHLGSWPLYFHPV